MSTHQGTLQNYNPAMNGMRPYRQHYPVPGLPGQSSRPRSSTAYNRHHGTSYGHHYHRGLGNGDDGFNSHYHDEEYDLVNLRNMLLKELQHLDGMWGTQDSYYDDMLRMQEAEEFVDYLAGEIAELSKLTDSLRAKIKGRHSHAFGRSLPYDFDHHHHDYHHHSGPVPFSWSFEDDVCPRTDDHGREYY